ncbi:MAG TPA: bifunctional rhamnulose-1-phosphate aldolase/short-chain dehydrogenase [Acidimicrobiia bacterium]|nr:bifunctional rhamnulose-1-phosphate aldolase/short-chain dehydrogenase [Acidimicrobiia bacterium]
MPAPVDRPLQQLLDRSHRLGADRRITNFAGGNTSAKLTLPDPVTGAPTRVLAVKGSGGDLGTLTESGVALLVLDRVLALESKRRRGTPDDDVVGFYAACRFGDRDAVPSIDTPLHAFVGADHVDHLHPDSVIALATAADGERLVASCYGDDVAWIPWQRPGFDLAIALRDLLRARPGSRGVVLGGHGLISWGRTSDECEETSLELIERAERYLDEHGDPEPFGPVVDDMSPLDELARRSEAARLAPVVRGLASIDRRVVGCFSDAPVVLDFLAREAAPRLVELGTSCPDHFLRTKVRALLLDAAPGVPFGARVARLRELHDRYRADYAAYYTRHAGPASPPMRGADPAIVLVPGVGMWSFGPDALGARVAGEFFVNAINVMRGAESVSSYSPIPEREKFGVEYWELEERKLGLRPPAPPLQGRVALVTGAGSGIGRAIAERLAEAGACVVVADIDGERAEKVASSLGTERALAVTADVSDESGVDRAFTDAALRFGGVDLVVNNAGFAASSALVDTPVEEWDRLHDVLARGAFLVSRAGARTMIASGVGGDIVYVVSKNAIAAGPRNVAYGSAKADQAQQVRLLAAELGEHGIRVNGVNPDGVVEGSGIFAGAWREERAAAHGVEPDQLARFYAERTLLGRQVLPAHVAEAVLVLTAGALSRTTGLLVPVDGGVTSAFLR